MSETGSGVRRPIEPGRCVGHGYVIVRCCALFEPLRQKPFLESALKAVLAARLRDQP